MCDESAETRNYTYCIRRRKNLSFEVSILWHVCHSISFAISSNVNTHFAEHRKQPRRQSWATNLSLSLSLFLPASLWNWKMESNLMSRSNTKNGAQNLRNVKNEIIFYLMVAGAFARRQSNEIVKSNLSKISIFYRIVIRLPPATSNEKWNKRQTANSKFSLRIWKFMNDIAFASMAPPHRRQNQLSIISGLNCVLRVRALQHATNRLPFIKCGSEMSECSSRLKRLAKVIIGTTESGKIRH